MRAGGNPGSNWKTGLSIRSDASVSRRACTNCGTEAAAETGS